MKGRRDYGAKKCFADGHKFDSRKEMHRYHELKMLERAGEISGLELQPRFELLPTIRWNGETLSKRSYVADFRYTETLTGNVIVEDVKGFKTDVYKLKRQMFLHRYGREYMFIET